MNEDVKKETAKMKRICMEIAGEIHDIVEERLWQDYSQLPALCEKLLTRIGEYEKLQIVRDQNQ